MPAHQDCVSELLSAADPFADADDNSSKAGAGGGDSEHKYVHIRVQQRNGKKSLTTVQVCRQFCLEYARAEDAGWLSDTLAFCLPDTCCCTGN